MFHWNSSHFRRQIRLLQIPPVVDVASPDTRYAYNRDRERFPLQFAYSTESDPTRGQMRPESARQLRRGRLSFSSQMV